MAEIVFAKERGKDRKENLNVNLEEFIAVKGIGALGNQLTKEKINQVNLLEPLSYEAPDEVHADEIEVVDETLVATDTQQEQEVKLKADSNLSKDDEGQTKLF